jgi:Flp pilus assembly protein TadD
MILAGRMAAPAEARDRNLHAGIACLDRVLVIAPANWAALWVRGKAFQSLGDHQSAADSFGQAYQFQSANPDVGRELVLELLETGSYPRALAIAERLAGQHPENAGLRANLALARVMAHDVSGAVKAIDEALRLDPRDAVTKALKQRIGEIAGGSRPPPKTLHELEAG